MQQQSEAVVVRVVVQVAAYGGAVAGILGTAALVELSGTFSATAVCLVAAAVTIALVGPDGGGRPAPSAGRPACLRRSRSIGNARLTCKG